MTGLSNTAKKNIVNHIYPFYLCFVANNYGAVTAPHIEELSNKLEDLFKPNTPNRLCVAMPPQHSKSSLITLAFSCWLICNNPSLRILIVNAEKELSTTFGIHIRNLLYHAAPFFDGLEVSNVKSSSTHLMFEKNGELQLGEIRLTGASGSITGHPVDVIIVDDPYKGLEDEFTPTPLKKKWNWFTTLIEQRLRKNTKLVLLHTRWHSEDIQGQIKADDYQSSKYQFVEYPAIDVEGNPLWGEYYDLDFYYDKQRTMGERRFQAIYQQKPLDLTGDLFHIDKLIFEDHFDKYAIGKCRSWDLASSDDTFGDKRDYTVGVSMIKVSDGEYWIFDYERGQYGLDVKQKILNTAKIDKASYTILIEPGTKGGASKLLYEEYKEALPGYYCEQSEPVGTKVDRATPFANAIFDGKIHICINNNAKRELFLSELKSFPNGKHDDMVDACAYAYNYLKDKGSNIGSYGMGKQRYMRRH